MSPRLKLEISLSGREIHDVSLVVFLTGPVHVEARDFRRGWTARLLLLHSLAGVQIQISVGGAQNTAQKLDHSIILKLDPISHI